MRTNIRLWLLLGATVAVRCWFLITHRLDSDEPQHLHVAWAWTRGLVQYRDVFDNHLPLLHVLFAPLLAVVPEGSQVFSIARWAIAPFAIACAWLLYSFVRPMFGTRTAIAAAVLFSVLPPWMPKSVEFRNDVLWIFFWLAALALLARRSRAAFLLAGIALGLSLLASVKTIPLLLAHLLVLVTQRRPVAIRAALQIAVGMAIPLGIAAACMLAVGALDDLVFATISYNAAAPVPAVRRIGGVIAFAIGAPLLVLAWTRAGRNLDHPVARLVLFTIWYTAVLLCFWPIVTGRDFLPIVPVAAIAVAMRLPERRWLGALTAATIAAVVLSVIYDRPWRPPEQWRGHIVDAAVRVTAPDDYVFDLKGDAIFRRRPVYYVYEDVGRALIETGAIPDAGPEQIAARGCCAAIRDVTHIPTRTRAFLNKHFIGGKGPLRVCGVRVTGPTFDIAVPQTYAVLARDPHRVVIDGVPYRGPRRLEAGQHSLSGGGNGEVTVIWWRAAREAL
ncbi:MAG TPA: glycosyltransferase family 39 protein [Thermoanaerobaculia bacterium]|nr:glycosyltransferase family 39 protein [Thermoanaerobaculia bacterium]